MKVPLLDLKAQYAAIREEIKIVVDEVLESQLFILGEKVTKLEEAVASYSDTKLMICSSSSLAARLLSLLFSVSVQSVLLIIPVGT